MTEVSKEAVEAAEAIGTVFEEITGKTFPWSWSLQAVELLASEGFTIAPTATVTDEKLRELSVLAHDILDGEGYDEAALEVKSALSELAQRRAEEINLKADNARIRELAECYNNEIEQWQKRYMALAESTLKVNAIPSIMMPLPTPPKED